MNKFAPKAQFLKQRAISLHKSGYGAPEVARMLQISKYTAYCWLDREYKERRTIEKAIARAGMEAVKREPPLSGLPTLARVPQIVLSKDSKYRMEAANVHR